jgi:hypothetical protein
MKIRTGFVSNSSSSSYTCEVCGEEASGWDLCPSECGMIECARGHVFCEEHRLENPEAAGDRPGYGIDVLCCPVCQLQTIRDRDMKQYLLKKVGLTEDQVAEEIRKNFKALQDLQNFIK